MHKNLKGKDSLSFKAEMHKIESKPAFDDDEEPNPTVKIDFLVFDFLGF